MNGSLTCTANWLVPGDLCGISSDIIGRWCHQEIISCSLALEVQGQAWRQPCVWLWVCVWLWDCVCLHNSFFRFVKSFVIITEKDKTLYVSVWNNLELCFSLSAQLKVLDDSGLRCRRSSQASVLCRRWVMFMVMEWPPWRLPCVRFHERMFLLWLRSCCWTSLSSRSLTDNKPAKSSTWSAPM